MEYLSSDMLTVCMVIYLSLLSFFIIKYSHKNYEREANRGKWLFWLYMAVLSSLLLFITNHILLVFFGFVGISVCLHHLLLSFPEREGSRKVVWKKFILSRLGDAFFLLAIHFFYNHFGTFLISEASETIQSIPAQERNDLLLLPSLFFGIACLIKSAQFPFHFWLPDTIDAPTPVSAIMHAGIINAGGFLLVKFHFLFPEGNPVLWVIMISGLSTVWIGGLSMLTQTDVKRKLAYSTLGQMGFMMVEFALGLYPLVILHLMGHGFYKAYGFLTAGNREFIPALPFKSSKYRMGFALVALILPVSLGFYYKNTEMAMLLLFGIILLGFLPARGWISTLPIMASLLIGAIFLPKIGEWVTGVNLNQDYHDSLHSWIGIFSLSILGFFVISLPVWKNTSFYQTLYCLSLRGFLSSFLSDKFIQRVKS